MGWKNVCRTARSGIWVLKGDAGSCVTCRNGGSGRHTRPPWSPPGHDCLCSYSYGHGAAVRPQTNDAIWDGVIGLWGRFAPLLSPWCAMGNVPTGVNLNPCAGSILCIPWHSNNRPLFGPQNSPKLVVSLSLGNSVEFKVCRRAPGEVPSSIRLDPW